MLLLYGNLTSGPSNILPSSGLGKVNEFTEEVVEKGESHGMGVRMLLMVSLRYVQG